MNTNMNLHMNMNMNMVRYVLIRNETMWYDMIPTCMYYEYDYESGYDYEIDQKDMNVVMKLNMNIKYEDE